MRDQQVLQEFVDLFLTLLLKQLLRWNPHDLAISPDHDWIAGLGMIPYGFRHGFLQSFLGLDVNQVDASLQTTILSHGFTAFLIFANKASSNT